jgi:2-(1,2-epoxy-1,2-dihydrophenyl)acetyl-CoA isomerase
MPDLLVSVKDNIATLTLNRPEARNALSPEMRELLRTSMQELATDDNVRCLIIKGAGDLVIADPDSFFTLAYCHIGTSPDGGASFQLPRIVGTKKAMEIALLGDRFDARTAQGLGMVNFVAEAGALEDETKKLATRLASGPTNVYGNTKKLLYRSLDNEFEAQLQMEAEMFADCASKPNFKEGVTAFIEKRKACFKVE